ncbi:MAG: flagellar hook-associated protein FlgK [Planctomycetota bacterium]|nr:MAG: flagellar hook-associated protein FlgK [Planctomycetota bacterium]
MSLFATIQQSANALQVSQLGLNVVGNNIANANTPGYIRQELVQQPGAGVRIGDTILGYGVRAVGVRQKYNEFVFDQMRLASSSLASSEKLDETYSQIEAIFSELSSSDISSQLSEFSASIHDVLNQPGNAALRRLVIERGRTLTSNIRTMAQRFTDIGLTIEREVQTTASDINRLTQQIAQLNQRIVSLEGGRTSGSDAVGLRDERLKVLRELSDLVDVRAVEQPSGAVTVYAGGEYLVADGIFREVAVSVDTSGENNQTMIHLADTDAPLIVSAGKLHGLYQARDRALGEGLDALDQFANDLMAQFNAIHTQGQGQRGFTSVTGTNVSDDVQAPLDLAGYQTPVENGAFEIVVRDLETGQTNTHRIRVQLSGAVDDTSLEDLRDAVSAISGLTASILPDGEFRIESDSTSIDFAFQNDTSGFLAAAGINTFFVGSSAQTIDLNPVVADDPAMLAASLTGIGNGTDNALALANAFDLPQAQLGDRSIKQVYEDLVVQITQDINVQSGVSDGLRNYLRTLESEHLAASGVNLDEEAVKMIFYQRAFQASSRLIQASSEMLDVLVNL